MSGSLSSLHKAVAAPAEDLTLSLSDVRSIFGVLLRRWKLIVVVPLIAVLAAYGALKLIPPLYKSTAEILVVDPKRPTNAADDRRLSTLDVDTAAMESEVAVLSSKAVALRVAKQLTLDKDPEFQRTSRLAAVFARLGLPRAAAWLEDGQETVGDAEQVSPELDLAAEELRRHRLNVERVQFSYVLAVSVTSEDPGKAQRLTAAVAKAYLDDQLEARYEATQRATSWLAGRLDDLRGRVIETETRIEKLKAESGLSDTGSAGSVSQQQTSDLNNQLVLARADVAQRRASYDQARHIVAGSGNIQTIPEVIASPVIGQLRAQRAETSRKAADLTSRFGERYPEVIDIRSQLADLDKTIGAEVSRILDNLKNAYEAALQRERSLEGSLENLTDQRGNSPALIKLRELQRVDDANRKLYENFLQISNEIEQRSTLNDTGARIITPAMRPNEPSYPRRTLVFALAVALGILLGVALAFLVEYLDGGFKTRAQVEQTLGCPVLGMIPLIRTLGPRRRTTRDLLARMRAAPLSALSEAIRSARVGLLLSDVDKPPKLVLVTSAIPDEGKSTAAVLFAASAAASGQRSLLIDCDLRRKSASRTFERSSQPGLVEVLAGDIDIADGIYHDEATGLDVIAAGSGAINPGDLLNSQRMRDVLTQLREHYDFIVLDSSPILPVIDAAVLATMVDKIVLVVQWSRTPRMSAIEAMKGLSADTRRIAGVLMNKVDLKKLRAHGYGYGYGYHYGRYYGALSKYYRRS